MFGFLRRTCCLSLCVCACGASDSKDSRAPAPGAQVEAPYESSSENPLTGVAALAGSWNGSADVKGYGMGTALVTLDHQGRGHYLVTLAEISRNGPLQVRFWDGRWLHGEAMGQEERIRGTLTGDRLRLELPFVGTVFLQREPR